MKKIITSWLNSIFHIPNNLVALVLWLSNGEQVYFHGEQLQYVAASVSPQTLSFQNPHHLWKRERESINKKIPRPILELVVNNYKYFPSTNTF